MSEGISAEQVLTMLDALEEAGCWVSLAGGWGVNALVGHETRPRRDLDVDAAHEAAALAALARLGYQVETDWRRPTRVELAAPGRGWVDVHSLTFDAEGNGYQTGLNGERYQCPAASFVTGHLLGRPVRCLSAAQQLEWHGDDVLDRVAEEHLVALGGDVAEVGSSRVLGMGRSGWWAGSGSVSQTSSPAPAMALLSSASRSACSSTIGPREV
jgi:lincosamide nucleotidyltransferase A/C/D/E